MCRCSTAASARPRPVKDGKVRAIAVTGDHRDPSMPDVSTLQESGLKGADVASIWGLHAPPQTPIERRRLIRDSIVAAMQEPDVKKSLADRGYEPIGNTPEEQQARTATL